MLLFLTWVSYAAPLTPDPQHARVPGTEVAFVHSRFVEIEHPTSLAFGPDGRLYVSRVDGRIFAYRVARVGPGRYQPTDVESIDAIQQLPNHDDDGRARPELATRLVTGLATAGTAARPVLYVTSSDPRLGNKGLTELGMDTHSGVVSRLTWTGAAWAREDLVTGLPRSREDHAPHGLALRGDTLFWTEGGNTNMGAPSRSFSGLAETPLSAAILTLDLATPGAKPQVYATGFRNAYDLVFASDGGLYTVDNGPNTTWGGPPTDCTARAVEGGTTYPDTLHRVSPGTFGGHPNPERGECTFLPPSQRTDVVATFPTSTNGIAEYTGSAFGGALRRGLLTVSFDGALWWLPEGLPPSVRPPQEVGGLRLADTVGVWPVDVTALGDEAAFPGTIRVAAYATGRIQVLEPE